MTLVAPGEEANQQREMSELLKSRGCIQSASSKGLPPDDEQLVSKLVEARVQAKKDRNFDLADTIRDRLMDEYNVYIQDKSKLWSVGGDFSSEGGGMVRNDFSYQRVGGGDEPLSDDDLKAISDLIWNRAKARKERKFADADACSDLLFTKYSVRTDDNNKQWWVETEGYTQEAPSPRSRVLSADEIAAVEDLLMQRLQLKIEKEFEEADAIRDELRHVYSVEVNDRTRSWWTLEDEGKPWTDEGSDLADAELSVQSYSNFDQDELAEEESPSNVAVASHEDLNALTVPELKERLRSMGKPVSGKKAELIERILS
jgi:cysteinyl-tRNA synthetase